MDLEIELGEDDGDKVDLDLATTQQILNAGGPFGLCVLVGGFLWRVIERKDKEYRELGQKMIDMVEQNTRCSAKLEASVGELRASIADLTHSIIDDLQKRRR